MANLWVRKKKLKRPPHKRLAATSGIKFIALPTLVTQELAKAMLWGATCTCPWAQLAKSHAYRIHW